MQIAKYFASLGFDVDTRGLKKVDKALDTLEKKLKKFNGFGNLTFGVGNFNIDQKKLVTALGTALDLASRQVTFEVTKFAIDRAALNRALSSVGVLGGSGAGTAATSVRNPSPEQLRRRGIRNAEFDRQEALRRGLADRRFALQGQRLNLQEERLASGNSVRSAAAGGVGASLGRFGLLGPALALGAGGYGLGALNQRNQQVVSAQLQTSAVVQQAGGTAQQGADSFQYLRSEANRVGFNYLDASQDYNKLISGLTGSGVSLGASQKVFSGFAELARVNKLDKTTQNRLFRALSQVAGKGKLQSEELTGQISEALPGGTALFAQAYQDQLRAKGGKGGLTGQAAIQALLADMKKGKVTGEILTYAGARASTQANAGGALARATTASQAEQQRYQNATNDLAVIASDNGVEEGFARIFRTLNAGLEQSGGLVRGLSEGFNEATKWADDLLLWPQDFVRALEGRDSLVADWLGAKDAAELRQNWIDIKTAWKDITSIPQPSWMPSLLDTTRELARLLDLVSKTLSTSQQSKGIIQEEYDKDPSTWGNIKGLAKANWFTFTNTMDAINPMDMTVAKNNWGGWLGIDSWKNAKPEDGFVQSVDDLNTQSSEAAKADAADRAVGITNNNTDLIINLTIDPVTLGSMDIKGQAEALANEVGQRISVMFEQASVQFPTKE